MLGEYKKTLERSRGMVGEYKKPIISQEHTLTIASRLPMMMVLALLGRNALCSFPDALVFLLQGSLYLSLFFSRLPPPPSLSWVVDIRKWFRRWGVDDRLELFALRFEIHV